MAQLRQVVRGAVTPEVSINRNDRALAYLGARSLQISLVDKSMIRSPFAVAALATVHPEAVRKDSNKTALCANMRALR